MKKIVVTTLIGMGLTGCGSLAVKPVPNPISLQPNNVCIEDNPKVIVPMFNEHLVEAFSNHGLKSTVYKENSNLQNCQTKLRYTALRSWDMGIFLSTVHLELLNSQDVKIGTVDWVQNPWALNKWRADQKKLNFLIGELLGESKK